MIPNLSSLLHPEKNHPTISEYHYSQLYAQFGIYKHEVDIAIQSGFTIAIQSGFTIAISEVVIETTAQGSGQPPLPCLGFCLETMRSNGFTGTAHSHEHDCTDQVIKLIHNLRDNPMNTNKTTIKLELYFKMLREVFPNEDDASAVPALLVKDDNLIFQCWAGMLPVTLSYDVLVGTDLETARTIAEHAKELVLKAAHKKRSELTYANSQGFFFSFSVEDGHISLSAENALIEFLGESLINYTHSDNLKSVSWFSPTKLTDEEVDAVSKIINNYIK